MADFLLGPDGQGALEKFYYGSAAKNQPFKRWRPERGLTSEKYEKELVYWEKLMMSMISAAMAALPNKRAPQVGQKPRCTMLPLSPVTS